MKSYQILTSVFWTQYDVGADFGRLDELTVDEEDEQSIYVYTPERTKGLTIVSVYSCYKDDAAFSG